jgi:PAS domain S-box-containing protein
VSSLLLFDDLEVQIWTSDLSGALTFVNDFTARYFGRARDVLIGEGWQNVLHAADVPATVERWTHSLSTGEPYLNDFRLLRDTDRVYRWHAASARKVVIDGEPMWLGSNVDVDADRRADEILQSFRQQLHSRAGS